MPSFEEIVDLANDARKRITEISRTEADELLAAGAILLDVREEGEFHSQHLSGAIHLSRDALDRGIGSVAPDKSLPIICYCTVGHRSALAAHTLQKLGYSRVTSLAGGLKAYLAAATTHEIA